VSEVVDRIRTSHRKPPAQLTPGAGRRRVGRLPSHNDEDESEDGVELLELIRDERIYPAEKAADFTIKTGDVLLVAAPPNTISRFVASTNTRLASVLADDERVPASSIEQKVVEAAVMPESPFEGHVP
jgi:hypothetical protein